MDGRGGRWSLDVPRRSHSTVSADRKCVYTGSPMQTWWALALGLSLWSGSHSGGHSPVTRVRAVTPLLRTLIADTAARSPTVRDLLARLACTDVIVYVELTPSPQVPTAATRLVTSVRGVRFLRISISAAVSFGDLAPQLAHELQHAVEIAEQGEVSDAAGVRRLYQRIGRARGDDRFETDAAREVEGIVRGELRRKIGG